MVTLWKQKNNTMVIYIEKIKTKEGINSLNLDKIKKEIPAEFQIIEQEPTISFTSNHVVVAFKVKLVVAKKATVAKKANEVIKKAVVKKKTGPAKA